MSNIDYCRLPSITCSMRTGNSKSYFNQPETCSLFNPDQVNKVFSDVNSKVPINNINQYNVCYKDYPKEGRAGDYFCKLNNDGRCVGYPVDCDPKHIQRKRDDSQIKFNVPNDVQCLSPNQAGCSNMSSNDGAKIYIDGKPFFQCQKTKDGKDDEMCINNLYTASQYGLPIDQSTSDPPDKNILYTNRYDKSIRNSRIVSCPTGYDVNGELCYNIEKDEKCIPSENHILGSPLPQCDYGNGITNLFTSGAPHLNQFRTERQCLDWCAKNPDCRTVVNYLDRNGKLQCRYYQYDTKDNRIKIIDDKTGTINNKRQHQYVADPNEELLPKYDFASIPINPNTKQRGNLIDGCGLYGCCADGSKKANKNGSNCAPFTPNSGLIGDPYEPYQYSALGGTGKMGTIDNLSGNAYN
jgi:hypothetical protein